MARQKSRKPISETASATIQFEHDRTCCVCHIAGKATQIHHIDDDPSNDDYENLALLCLQCHNETQTRGGFGRRLNAAAVRRFRSEWVQSVSRRRQEFEAACISAMVSARIKVQEPEVKGAASPKVGTNDEGRLNRPSGAHGHDLKQETSAVETRLLLVADTVAQQLGVSLRISRPALVEAVFCADAEMQSMAVPADGRRWMIFTAYWIASLKPVRVVSPNDLFGEAMSTFEDVLFGSRAKSDKGARQSRLDKAEQAYSNAADIPINEMVALQMLFDFLDSEMASYINGLDDESARDAARVRREYFNSVFLGSLFTDTIHRLRFAHFTPKSFTAFILGVFAFEGRR